MVRLATLIDVPHIRRLYHILFSDMAALEPTYWRAAHVDPTYLMDLIDGEETDILLYEDRGHIVGFVVVQAKQTPGYTPVIPYSYAYLMDLVVLPDRRSSGIGAALIDAVEDWAKARDLAFVELNVLDKNLRARDLYTRIGYEDSMHTMRKLLK